MSDQGFLLKWLRRLWRWTRCRPMGGAKDNATTRGQIVLAFTPSSLLKDWCLRSDGDHHWFYEHRVSFYDTGCERYQAQCYDHPRAVGNEPFYDLTKRQIVSSPRLYVDHHPLKCEWEHLQTTDDLKASPLLVEAA